MAGARAATQTRDLTEEVTVGRYLAGRRPVRHLFEICPDLDSADGVAGSDPVTSVASTVRARGDRETDVCLLIDDGERHAGFAADLAENLRCDVYLTPQGAAVRYLHQRSPATGELWEAVAVDFATGQPVEWLVVRPRGLPANAATWFTSVAGRLRPGRGLVTVALPDGLAFATRTTHRDTALLAARLVSSGHRITTLAVNVEVGLFDIARFEDTPAEPRGDAPTQRSWRFGSRGRDTDATVDATPAPATRLHGTELAALVRASLDVVHSDVQVALTWPKDAAACATLHTELLGLAEGLDRTVWVPEPQGAAFVLPGIGEFAAVDEVGAPSRWRAYPPPSAQDATTLFGTDLDGRLTPLGEVSAARFTGVRFVSVPAPQLEHLREWYSAIAPPPGLFPVDLTVLPDGRLGVVLAHGVSVVAGPRELRELLRAAGWTGEELLLLAQPPAELWNTTIEHARTLVDGLRTDLWLATLGADVWVQPDGTLAADGPDGGEQAWCCVAFGRTAANVMLPPALQVPRAAWGGRAVSRPTGEFGLVPTTPEPTMASLDPSPYGFEPYGDLTMRLATLPAAPVSPGLPALSSHATPALDTTSALGAAGLGAAAAAAAGLGTAAGLGAAGGAGAGAAAVGAAGAEAAPGPGLGRPLGTAAPHGVPWLPGTPAVTSRPVELYLWTPQPGDLAEAWTIPSADLFLLAGTDPLRLAERRPAGHLLRLSVPERGAVDLAEHARQAPAELMRRVGETGNTHLLPLAWLSDMRVTARYDLDGMGGVRSRTDVSAGALAIRFEGAEHGVSGLPNEVVHWPDKGSRADAPCYLVLPDASSMSLEIVHGGFIALFRRKPAVEDGYRLLEVRVRRRRAVDVPATLDSLAGVNIVGRMHDFVGLDLLLPEVDLDKATVTKMWRRAGNRTVVVKLGGESLYDALLDESVLVGAPA